MIPSKQNHMSEASNATTFYNYADKRNSTRNNYNSKILLAFMNKGKWIEAQILNHCEEGMCIRSDIDLKSGALVLIRTPASAWSVSKSNATKGLRTITLGEVKWRRETEHQASGRYEAGVQYYVTDY